MLTFALTLSGYLTASVVLPRLEGVTKNDCAKACVQNDECFSFFFNTVTGMCQLDRVLYSSSAQLSAADSVLYYILQHVGCPEDYSYYGITNQCLKLYQVSMTFPDAKATCEADLGHLAFAKTQEANLQITQVAIGNRVWLGAHEVSTDVWQWLDGQSFGYTNWLTGKPDGREGRVFLRVDGSWDDHAPSVMFQIICEVDIDKNVLRSKQC